MAPSLSPFETALIPIAHVAIPANFRKPKPKKVAELKDSIAKDGLLQPIGVRRTPGAAKPFSLVFGGHRLEAHRQLRREDIEASILGISEAQAESATLAENLFRSPLVPAEYIRAMKKWQELYTAENPETVGRAVGGRAKAAARRAADPAMTTVGIAGEPPARKLRFDQVAAQVTGTSDTKTRRDLQSARNLSEADLDVLSDREVPLVDINRIGSIKDPGARSRAVALVASGMEPKSAVAFASAPEGATIEAGTHDVSCYAHEDDLPDEEWLEQFCKDALGRLQYRDAFRRDALCWRHCRPALTEFRNKTRKHLSQSKAYRSGPFQYRAISMVNILHPNDWPKCGPCNGTGQAGAMSQCPNCHGAGFSIRTGVPR